jgi:putative membrane protein
MTLSLVAALPLMTHHADDWGHLWWPLWPLLWVVPIGLAIWLVLRRRGRGPAPLDRAREIAAERYARGELSVEEYRERMRELGS